ncbi:MAG: hypothetical protein KC493_06430 [Bacteriovoracaceae bacterium]|nr:hypothetical protein [Bacteriovoracaceae bacterium]
MKKYILPFILVSLFGLFIFGITNSKAKFKPGDCVTIAAGRVNPDNDLRFVEIIGVDRMQYRILEYYQKKQVWNVSKLKFYTKIHLDQSSYEIECLTEVISSLKPKL